jgi:hypothetical protein
VRSTGGKLDKLREHLGVEDVSGACAVQVCEGCGRRYAACIERGSVVRTPAGFVERHDATIGRGRCRRVTDDGVLLARYIGARQRIDPSWTAGVRHRNCTLRVQIGTQGLQMLLALRQPLLVHGRLASVPGSRSRCDGRGPRRIDRQRARAHAATAPAYRRGQGFGVGARIVEWAAPTWPLAWARAKKLDARQQRQILHPDGFAKVGIGVVGARRLGDGLQRYGRRRAFDGGRRDRDLHF